MEAQLMGYGGDMYDVLDNTATTQTLRESLSNLSAAVKATEQALMAARQQFQQEQQQTDQLTTAMQTV